MLLRSEVKAFDILGSNGSSNSQNSSNNIWSSLESLDKQRIKVNQLDVMSKGVDDVGRIIPLDILSFARFAVAYSACLAIKLIRHVKGDDRPNLQSNIIPLSNLSRVLRSKGKMCRSRSLLYIPIELLDFCATTVKPKVRSTEFWGHSEDLIILLHEDLIAQWLEDGNVKVSHLFVVSWTSGKADMMECHFDASWIE